MLDLTFNKLKNINSLYELRLPIFFFGLAVWVATPIMGIFPLLLSIQLYLITPNYKKPKLISLTNGLLILVILTVSIYVSSFDIFADTRNYLDVYETIDTKGIFNNQYVQDRFEFVPFLFLYLINLLTNGSEYWCLLLFSLTINILVVFVISKKLSAKYYPTFLILVLSTSFYYSQVFYMRQFLSVVMVLMAIAYLNSGWLIFLFWSFLAIFSHFSSITYIAIYTISKIVFSIQGKIKIKFSQNSKIFLYILLSFIVVSLIYLGLQVYNNPQKVYTYVNSTLDLLPERKLSTSLQGRVTEYDGRDTELFSLTIFRIIAIINIAIFIIITGYKKLTSKLLSFELIYVASLFQIAFILVTGFNQRLAFFFLAFYGFLFNIGLNKENQLKPLGVISFLTMFAAAANTFNFLTIQVTMADVKGWTFFDGQPLAMSLYDYILYFFQSI